MTDTLPGGYYWNSERKRHEDAFGQPVEKHSDAELKKAREEHLELTPDQAEILAKEAQTRQRAQEAQHAADIAAAAAKTAQTAKGHSRGK